MRLRRRSWVDYANVSDVTIHPATEDDVRALARRRQSDELSFRLALELCERGTAWVARDQYEPVGVALAHDTDAERCVGDLFVEPSYRGRSVGTRLLEAAFTEADDLARSLLLDAGDHPRLALALRGGLVPVAEIVSVAGAIAREPELVSMAAGDYRFEVDAIDPIAHINRIGALDRETRGTTRAEDHQRFAREAVGLAFFLGGEFVAYAYVWEHGRIGPVASASASYLVQIFAYAMVTLQRQFGAAWCSALLPANGMKPLRALLRAGLRIERTLTLAAEMPMPDISRYAGFHPLFF